MTIATLAGWSLVAFGLAALGNLLRSLLTRPARSNLRGIAPRVGTYATREYR